MMMRLTDIGLVRQPVNTVRKQNEKSARQEGISAQRKRRRRRQSRHVQVTHR